MSDNIYCEQSASVKENTPTLASPFDFAELLFIIDVLAHAVSVHVSTGNGSLGKTKEQVIKEARQAYQESQVRGGMKMTDKQAIRKLTAIFKKREVGGGTAEEAVEELGNLFEVLTKEQVRLADAVVKIATANARGA